MYTLHNFKTKKAFREAFDKGEKIGVFKTGPFPVTQTGRTAIEGPHYPEPHKWYASVKVKNSIIVRIIS